MTALSMDILHGDVDVACTLVPGEKGFVLHLVASRARTKSTSHFAQEFPSTVEAANMLSASAGRHAMIFSSIFEVTAVGGITETFKSFAELIRRGSPEAQRAHHEAMAAKAMPCTEAPSQTQAIQAMMFKDGKYSPMPQ